MNAERRKQIAAVKSLIDDIRGKVEKALQEVNTIRDAEQEAFDALPESFQNGEKGDKAQAALDALQEAIDAIELVELDEIDTALDTAAE